MVKRTRDRDSNLGSRAVPMTTVLELLPRLFPPSTGSAVTGRKRTIAEGTADINQGRTPPTISDPEVRSNAVDAPTLHVGERGTTAALPPRSEFVGRADKIARLRDALTLPIVAIEGMAGVGKTALALEVAHGWSSLGFEGVVWAPTLQRPGWPR